MKLWFCDGNMEKNRNIVDIGIPWSGVYMGAIPDQPMVYEQDDVAYAIVMRHGLM